MEKGKLIVLEGACDGIGKTTQFHLLKDRLLQDKIDIVTHHFPSYGTYHGLFVEKYLNGEYGNITDLSPYLINDFYAIDRAIAWKMKLKEHYENGAYILLDRYTTSSIIYQASVIKDMKKRLEFINYVIDFEYHKLEVKEPDCTIFLRAPFDLITKIRMARVNNDGIQNDIHEKNLKFMKGVYENAIFVANYLNWKQIECSRNNEMKPVEEIHEEIYSLIRKKVN